MASKRRIRRKQCEGKTRFTDPTEAQKAVVSVRRAGKKGITGVLVVYKCPHCNGYHFGHRSHLP